MVRANSKNLRPAIAMIELIFALVIMGIVMMSAPMLISTAQKSSFASMQQEAINQASSRVLMIMGYAWDENNTNDVYIPILHTTNGNADLNMDSNSRRRGTPRESQRTYIFKDGNITQLSASLNLGMESNDSNIQDDIDDFIGNISLIGTQATTDYIEQDSININTDISYSSDALALGNYNQATINYIPFNATTGTSNIKSIVVTLTSTDNNNSDLLAKTIIFRAFSCNIGSYSLETRSF
jgi:type II secretory pathway pseudopilin PulG